MTANLHSVVSRTGRVIMTAVTHATFASRINPRTATSIPNDTAT